MTNTQARGQALISYELRTLENVAELYPAEMREPFLWLAQFADDNCGRNLAALEAKLKSIGLPTTSGTISKIIRGKWDRNSKGEKVPPVMSLRSFISMVEQLRAHPDIKEMASAVDFVITPTAQQMMNYIDVRRSPNAGVTNGLTLGDRIMDSMVKPVTSDPRKFQSMVASGAAARGVGGAGSVNVEGHRVSLAFVNGRNEMRDYLNSAEGEKHVVDIAKRKRVDIGIPT